MHHTNYLTNIFIVAKCIFKWGKLISNNKNRNIEKIISKYLDCRHDYSGTIMKWVKNSKPTDPLWEIIVEYVRQHEMQRIIATTRLKAVVRYNIYQSVIVYIAVSISISSMVRSWLVFISRRHFSSIRFFGVSFIDDHHNSWSEIEMNHWIQQQHSNSGNSRPTASMKERTEKKSICYLRTFIMRLSHIRVSIYITFFSSICV